MRLPDEVATQARAEARRLRDIREHRLADLLGESAWWLDRLGAGRPAPTLPREDPQFDDHREGHGLPPEEWDALDAETVSDLGAYLDKFRVNPFDRGTEEYFAEEADRDAQDPVTPEELARPSAAAPGEEGEAE